MWLTLTYGFFSIVRKPGENLLTVRARARGDLERLRDRHLPELGAITAGGGTDYPFRARVEPQHLTQALSIIVADITYPNFKSAVAAELGAARAHVYGEVWSSLHGIEDEAPSASREKLAYGGVVLDAHGRVLLREPAGHYGGYVWTFPKGRPARGETPESAALREVREETGVEARIAGRIPGRFRGDTSDTEFFLMRVVVDHGDFDRGETAQVRWATPDEARELLRQTRSERGRARDLEILDAALR